ncbi:MAG: T9SS sorting signal type C domain-containing protein [Dysgonomonas sp.]
MGGVENTINTVSVYDLQGRLIHRKNMINDTQYEESLNLGNNIYIVKVEDTSSISKSVRIRLYD